MPYKPNKKFADFHAFDFEISENQVLFPASMTRFHYHNSYEIYYLNSGERYYFINDKTYHIKKGSLVLIKAYDLHCTATNQDASYKRTLINFKKPFLSALSDAFPGEILFSCFEKGINIVELDLAEQDFVEMLFARMLLEQSRKAAGSALFLKTSLAQLLITVNRKTDPLPNGANEYISPIHKIINEAVAYIGANYNQDISLQVISEKFFISPYYFSRTFKAVTGLSFVDFLNQIRIKEAQRLMHTTTMNITQISEAAGYKSTTHFGRIFKKHTGVSPMAYKKGAK